MTVQQKNLIVYLETLQKDANEKKVPITDAAATHFSFVLFYRCKSKGIVFLIL